MLLIFFALREADKIYILCNFTQYERDKYYLFSVFHMFEIV